MKPEMRAFALMLAATVLAASLAGWFGVQYGIRHAQPPDLHTVLHHDLALTLDQDRKIETLEAQYAAKKKLFDHEMRAANRDLAEALSQDHAYGAKAQHAIERFHKAMMALQEDTVRHVLAMRAVLTPDQAKTFDTAVTKSLTGPQ
jgi:nickel and cobalt resistance protein CnrR